ncbi:Uncharacterized protein dnm_081360 [Desulfonema magnum]|uniref:Uncharacterized protein n=1 Tax=Desulfonema magnum TaxID=45655 RepID=A0A975BVD5_9BACT|nr:Uncharacterized protein dnm_081360 [Desulfonema magnum]
MPPAPRLLPHASFFHLGFSVILTGNVRDEKMNPPKFQ